MSAFCAAWRAAKLAERLLTDVQVKGVPIVINPLIPEHQCLYLAAGHEYNLTGSDELQCREDVFERIVNEPQVMELQVKLVEAVQAVSKAREKREKSK
jgi:hypothetical protein